MEEEKQAERRKKVQGRKKPVSQISHKDYRTRFQKPTYFAVLIGKIIYRFRRPPPRSRPVSPTNGIEGYVERDFVEPPKVTAFTIIREDLQNLPKKIMRGGIKKTSKGKEEKVLPTKSKDSFEDWKDYFEPDTHAWQGGSKRE
jgi:hypothetical protein